MADNVAITAGSGTTVATDEVNTGSGSAHVQLVKLLDGTDGGTERIQGTAANGLEVDVTRLPALAAGTNNIGDVDVLSVVPGTTATSLGKAEDAGHSSGDVGVMALAVRNDAGTALAGTDADYIPLSTDSSGNLRVNVVTGGTAGTQYTEGDTDASITGTAALWEDAADTLRAVSMAKPLPVQPGTSITFPVTDNGGSLTVDGTVTANAGTGFAPVVTDGAAAGTTGTHFLGTDGTNAQIIKTDSAGELQVDVLTLPALVAGTANIGDVDVLTVPAPLSTTGGGTEATALRVTIANDSTGVVSVDDNGGSLTVDGTVTANAGTNLNTSALALEAGGNLAGAATSLAIMDDWDNGASDGASVSGDVAHDAADAGEPVKLGHKAVDLGANPTDVAANDRTNWYSMRNGVPFVIGGAPFVKSQNLQVTDADGAQTDTAILTAAANVAIMVTAIEITADNANTGDVSVRIGFGTANTPAADADKVIMFHPGIAPGSGVVKGSGAGIIGAGLSNEDLRVTCEDPAGGSISITVTYFTLAIG